MFLSHSAATMPSEKPSIRSFFTTPSKLAWRWELSTQDNWRFTMRSRRTSRVRSKTLFWIDDPMQLNGWWRSPKPILTPALRQPPRISAGVNARSKNDSAILWSKESLSSSKRTLRKHDNRRTDLSKSLKARWWKAWGKLAICSGPGKCFFRR